MSYKGNDETSIPRAYRHRSRSPINRRAEVSPPRGKPYRVEDHYVDGQLVYGCGGIGRRRYASDEERDDDEDEHVRDRSSSRDSDTSSDNTSSPSRRPRDYKHNNGRSDRANVASEEEKRRQRGADKRRRDMEQQYKQVQKQSATRETEEDIDTSERISHQPVSKPVKSKITVAAAFGESDDEEEVIPDEAKMRMRNIGRMTATSSGPNSYGKTNKGFTIRKYIPDDKEFNHIK